MNLLVLKIPRGQIIIQLGKERVLFGSGVVVCPNSKSGIPDQNHEWH